MTEKRLNRSEAAEYISINADPDCGLSGLDLSTLQQWHIDDYGPIPEVVEDVWVYLRSELDDFIEIQGLMAKGVIKP